MNPSDDAIPSCDVAIVGGAFSGSTLALLLKRARPETRILLVEKTTAFDRKVGESTSEVASCFLTRILGLTNYLNREHIAKNGLRLWFNDGENTSPGRCTEVGTLFQSRLPTYQIDRSRLDEHLLELATNEGCELLRGATVESDMAPDGKTGQLLDIRTASDETQSVRASWVVDASGKAAWLSRKSKRIERIEDHPVNAIWSRFRSVRDLDDPAVRTTFACPHSGNDPVYGSRSSGTNHLMGYGWWVWIIPLQDGDVSVGLVYDSRIFTPPEADTIAEKLHKHLLDHPIGKFLFENAEPVKKDTRSYAHLPYHSTAVAGDQWIVVGDAAGFIDPLYSQGLDYCGHTVYGAHRVILDALEGADVTSPLKDYNDRFQISYRRWYEALYQDKYYYMGDAELMFVAFLLDLATYFIGPVRLVYDNPTSEFALMPYDGTVGRRVAAFMRFYNRRLAAISKKRHRAGVYGTSNLDRRYLIPGLTPDTKVLRLLFKGIRLWLSCEIRSLFLAGETTKDHAIAQREATPREA